MGCIISKYRRIVEPHSPTSCQQTPSSSLSDPKTYQECQNRFFEEFQTKITAKSIHELRVLFSMVNVTTYDVCKSLFKYVNTRGFREVFQIEFEKFYITLDDTEKNKEVILSNTLKRHCLAVISVHLQITENLNNLSEVDTILDQTANGHSFLSDTQSSFKLHNNLLEKCLRNEFEKFMTRDARKSLKKYIKLTTKRLELLTEHWSLQSDTDSSFDAMAKQKKLMEETSRRFESLRQIYFNPASPSQSENWHLASSMFSTTSSTYIPSTSNYTQ